MPIRKVLGTSIMSSVTSREAAAMKSRRNLLAGYKIPKVQPVATSLQARIGGYDVVDERRGCEESPPRADNPDQASSLTETGINSGGHSSSLGTRYQALAGAHFDGKHSRARAAKQRKSKAGLAPAKKFAKRIRGVVRPSTPKRPRGKGPATTSKQPVVQPSAAGLGAPEPMYPFCLGAKERARKSWETFDVAPKPLGRPARPTATTQSYASSTPSSARVADRAMAPAPESPATISPNQAKDASRLSSSSRSTPAPKRQHHADIFNPSAEKKRKQADDDSGVHEVETPKKAKIRKIDQSPTSLEQDQPDLFMAGANVSPKKDGSTPLFRRRSLYVAEDGWATGDCEEAKVNPSASSSSSDLASSTKECLYAKSAMSIKEEEDCAHCTAVVESLQANFQLYTTLLRKEAAQDDSFTLWAAAHQQTLDAVSAVHQANHVKVKSE